MEGLWSSLETDPDVELSKYDAVIHLRTPTASAGYNLSNPLRVETPQEAAAIDARIAQAWERHPRRFVVDASADFLTKATSAIEILRRDLPKCCKTCVTPLSDKYRLNAAARTW